MRTPRARAISACVRGRGRWRPRSNLRIVSSWSPVASARSDCRRPARRRARCSGVAGDVRAGSEYVMRGPLESTTVNVCQPSGIHMFWSHEALSEAKISGADVTFTAFKRFAPIPRQVDVHPPDADRIAQWCGVEPSPGHEPIRDRLADATAAAPSAHEIAAELLRVGLKQREGERLTDYEVPTYIYLAVKAQTTRSEDGLTVCEGCDLVHRAKRALTCRNCRRLDKAATPADACEGVVVIRMSEFIPRTPSPFRVCGGCGRLFMPAAKQPNARHGHAGCRVRAKAKRDSLQ